MASCTSAHAFLRYHKPDSNGCFGVCVANGSGIFISEKLHDAIPLKHRVPLTRTPGQGIHALLSGTETLGSTVIEIYLHDWVTEQHFRMKIRVHVLEFLGVDMFIGGRTPLVKSAIWYQNKTAMKMDLNGREVWVFEGLMALE